MTKRPHKTPRTRIKVTGYLNMAYLRRVDPSLVDPESDTGLTPKGEAELADLVHGALGSLEGVAFKAVR